MPGYSKHTHFRWLNFIIDWLLSFYLFNEIWKIRFFFWGFMFNIYYFVWKLISSINKSLKMVWRQDKTLQYMHKINSYCKPKYSIYIRWDQVTARKGKYDQFVYRIFFFYFLVQNIFSIFCLYILFH